MDDYAINWAHRSKKSCTNEVTTKKRWVFAKERGVVRGDCAELEMVRSGFDAGSNQPVRGPVRSGTVQHSSRMSIEDTIGFRNETPACAVCGKDISHGGGFAHVKPGERMVELCCPPCVETFQKDPEPCVKRL